jgi:hypothetical protein
MKMRKAKRSPNYNREGYVVEMLGYVTPLISLINRSPAELERLLGFSAGRLREGWALYLLVQGVSSAEFLHQGTTRYSGGKGHDRDATQQLRDIGMLDERKGETIRVMRVDQMRYAMFRDTGNEQAFDLFRALEVAKLNQREGSSRIAKCVPLAQGSEYPDSPGNGVPQWEIIAPKRFACVAVLNPGQRYLGGGHPGRL